MPSSTPKAPLSPMSKLHVAVPAPRPTEKRPAAGRNFGEYLLEVDSNASMSNGSGGGGAKNYDKNRKKKTRASPPRPSFLRHSLSLNNTTISMDSWNSNSRSNNRPRSAQPLQSRLRRTPLNQSSTESQIEENVRRRQRLSRLINISSGKISKVESGPVPKSESMTAPEISYDRADSRHAQEDYKDRSEYSHEGRRFSSHHSRNIRGVASQYGGAHGRGVTISELRKQFRAVRAYAMSGPDARRIRSHGIDPKADVPDLGNYYSAVEVEGIPLPMGKPSFGAFDKSTMGVGGPQSDDYLARGMNEFLNRFDDGIVSAAGISPWGGASFSPRLSPYGGTFSLQSPSPQKPSPEKTEEQPLHSTSGRFSPTRSDTMGTGKERKLEEKSAIPSPRTVARHRLQKRSVSPPRMSPHARPYEMAKLGNRDKMMSLELEGHTHASFKLDPTNMDKAKKSSRPRPSTSQGTRRDVRKSKSTRMHNSQSSAIPLTYRMRKEMSSMSRSQRAKQGYVVNHRVPRPISASMARRMGRSKGREHSGTSTMSRSKTVCDMGHGKTKSISNTHHMKFNCEATQRNQRRRQPGLSGIMKGSTVRDKARDSLVLQHSGNVFPGSAVSGKQSRSTMRRPSTARRRKRMDGKSYQPYQTVNQASSRAHTRRRPATASGSRRG